MGFFDAFTGAAQKKQLTAANKQANQYLDNGYNQSVDYYNQAYGGLDQYAQDGAAGQKMYMDLLGINGADARAAAQGIITSDPQWSGKFAADSNAVLRNMNARGAGAGGAAALAGQRVLSQNYDNALSKYAGLGQQGAQMAGMQSQIRMGQGDNAYGYGATKAGNAMNYGNAMAQASGIGVNNLMNLIGTGVKAWAGMK